MSRLPCFDPHHVPFTREGAYLSICPPAPWVGPGELMIRYVHGAATVNELLRIELRSSSGRKLAYKASANPGECRLTSDLGTVRMAFDPAGALRVGVKGKIRLHLPLAAHGFFDYLMEHPDGCLINSMSCGSLFAVRCRSGTMRVTPDWRGMNSGGKARIVLFGDETAGEISLMPFRSAWPGSWPQDALEFDAVVASAIKDYQLFAGALRPLGGKSFDSLRALAAYGLWSCMVRPGGLLGRPAVLMSKGYMNHVWSWDSYLNAVGLAAAGMFDLAWDQVWTMLDHQDPDTGALPDFVDAHRTLWNFVKQPIHGWAISRVLDFLPKEQKRRRKALIQSVFQPISRWTQWWLNHRRPGGSDLPVYFHGNDGWDNATVFDHGVPVAGPELAAILAQQMDVLADWAAELGRSRDAARWRAASDAMVAALVDQLWKTDRFVARTPAGLYPQSASDGDCLLPWLPIVLGDRLPADVRARLVGALADASRFLTPWGLASESVSSPKYRDDPNAYWRGSVWAPPQLLAVDGLRRAGEAKLAGRITRAFMNACRQSGFAENFNARTGAAQRDPMYTWTITVFLTLAAMREGA